MPTNHPAPTSKKPKRKRYTGFIWPKDPCAESKSAKSLEPSRWLDIFSGRGPDIFLGNTSHPKSYPTRATWSQWSHVAGVLPDKTASFLPWPFPLHSRHRPPTHVYDFKARKYQAWTSDWHPANYPCAYCCAAPWRDCEHSDTRGDVAAFRPPPRRMRRGSECIDPGLLEANERECGGDGDGDGRQMCRRQHDRRHGPFDISDYRCDDLR